MRVEVESPILEEYKVNKELHEELCEKIQGLLIDILKQIILIVTLLIQESRKKIV